MSCLGGDFLAIKKMSFLTLWKYSLKALRTIGSFRRRILVQKEEKLRVDIEAGLKLLGSSYFFEHEPKMTQLAADSLVVLEKAKGTCQVSLFYSPKHILPKGGKCQRPVHA